MKYFLPEQLYLDIYSAKWFSIILFFVTSISIIIFTFKKKRLGVLISYIAFITMLSAFGTRLFYNIDYAFGQNDLMEFAKQEKELNHDIFVVNNPRKYSVLYYGKNVNYVLTNDEVFDVSNKIFNSDSTAIIRNKEYSDISEKYNLKLLKKARRYSLVKFLSKNQ